MKLREMTLAIVLGSVLVITGTTYVTALDFALSPQPVKIGTTGTLKMTCDVTEVDVAVIYNIQIRRETEAGSNYTWEILAEIEAGEAEIPALDEDIVNDKDFVAGGIFDKDKPVNTYLTLDMNIQKLTYSDARAYKCQLTYKSDITGSVAIVKKKATLSVYGAEGQDKGQSDSRNCSGYINKSTLSLVIALLLTTNVLTIVYAVYVTVMRRRSRAQRPITDENVHPTEEKLLSGLAPDAKHDRPDGQEKDVESL